eukprot:m.440099 g.440099  ORF g.440099 m.440099 type:complete len:60 (+) comp18463_c0_seq1:373-552(+)
MAYRALMLDKLLQDHWLNRVLAQLHNCTAEPSTLGRLQLGTEREKMSALAATCVRIDLG